jgi:hypothetical protein
MFSCLISKGSRDRQKDSNLREWPLDLSAQTTPKAPNQGLGLGMPKQGRGQHAQAEKPLSPWDWAWVSAWAPSPKGIGEYQPLNRQDGQGCPAEVATRKM